MARRFMTLITTLSIALIAVSSSLAGNTLNVMLGRMDDDGKGSIFYASIHANKDGATTAILTTPFGTYPLSTYGSSWYPDFTGSFSSDHSALPWNDLETLTANEWVLIWDEGLATQTTAHIRFDPLSESDFAPIPLITYPVNGADYPSGVSRVEWNYGAWDPCVAPIGEIRVTVYAGGGDYWESFGPLNCDIVSVVCSIPSFNIHHIVLITNVTSQQATADGIGGPITGDPWFLENEYWLLLDSRDQLEFTGQIVEVEGLSFGSLKAIFR